MSLTNHVLIAAAMLNVGSAQFWTQVMEELGVEITDSMASHFSTLDARRNSKRAREKDPKHKKKCSKRNMEKQKKVCLFLPKAF